MIKTVLHAQHIPADLVKTHWDYVFIGAGHNGLVCANYLAKRFPGRTVLMLEHRHLVGGAALSEEVFPGYTFSRFSYVFSIFRPKIIAELFPKNWKENLVLYKNDPYLFVPGRVRGDFALFSSDAHSTRTSLQQFASKQDASTYYAFMAMLRDLHRAIEPLLDTTPVNSWIQTIRTIPSLRQPKQHSINELLALITTSSAHVLNQWFQSDRLKAALSYSGTVGQMLSPYSTGSAFLQLHHVANTIGDKAGKYRYYPKGGMGAVSQYLAQLAEQKGVRILTSAGVEKINLHQGRATGVQLHCGTTINARTVISNCTYNVTFNKLLTQKDRSSMPHDFTRSLDAVSYETNCSKINLVLTDIPRFTALKGLINYNAPFDERRKQAAGYLHHILMAGDHMQDMHHNYLHAQQGKLPDVPTVQMLIPSLLDNSLTPEGSTDIIALLFVQYTPYAVRGGWNADNKRALMKNTVAHIERYAPGFGDLIKHTDILAPTDIEDIVHLTGGNIFHGTMSLDNLYTLRPIPGWAQYATPIDSLFCCSAASHPGGGVCGGSGRNAAREIIKHTR